MFHSYTKQLDISKIKDRLIAMKKKEKGQYGYINYYKKGKLLVTLILAIMIASIILSMLRKGTVDVPFMILFNHLIGIRGVAWATPVAEVTSLMVAAAMVIPYIRKLARIPETTGPVSETKTCKSVDK